MIVPQRSYQIKNKISEVRHGMWRKVQDIITQPVNETLIFILAPPHDRRESALRGLYDTIADINSQTII